MVMSIPKVALPLRNVVYRRLFSAQVIALVGTGLSTVALGLLAYDLAGGNAGEVLGIALALKMLSYVLVSPVVAALAEKVARKRLLITLDLVRALSVASIFFVTEIWQVYVLIVVLSSASAGFTPAFQAVIPDIFEDTDTYTEALSLSRLAYELELLLSPALAAVALMVMSFSGLFALNAVAFICSALLVFASAIPAVPRSGLDARKFSRITAGVRSFVAIPRLRALFALNLAAAAASAMVVVNTVVLVRDQFGLDDAAVALALGATGAGSMLVALTLPWFVKRITDRALMLTGGLLLCLSLLAASLIESMALLLPCWFVIGLGLALVQTPAGRLIQRSGNSEERPALFAAQFSLSHFCWLFTYPIAGFVGATLGLHFTAVVLALVAGLATVLSAWSWRNETKMPIGAQSNA